jgi:translation initiation factor 5B
MLCVPALTLDVGRVTSIENNHREVPSAKKGTSVSIKISNESNPQMTYGRQFDHTHTLYRSARVRVRVRRRGTLVANGRGVFSSSSHSIPASCPCRLRVAISLFFGSKLTRQSIDALKQYFKDDVSKEDWGLVVKLKKVFNIP